MARIFSALLVILVLGYLAWPYASLYGLFADLKAADVDAVRERVQWPTVRAGMKDDIDSFAEAAVNKAAGEKRMGGAKFTLSWKALPVADQIAGVFATPRGLIALFQNPGALRCALDAIKAANAGVVAGCLKRQQEAALKKPEKTGLEGPNLPRLLEKFDYAFFTGLFSFRFKVLHEGIPVTLDFIRRAECWILVRISLSFETLLAGPEKG